MLTSSRTPAHLRTCAPAHLRTCAPAHLRTSVPPSLRPALQFARGFVPSSAATEAEKEAQRTWDRSSLMAVKDDDAQVGIYNAYAHNSNTDGEGKSTRRGLGAGSEPSSARRGMGMSFVSAGGAPAQTAAAGGMAGFVAAGGTPYCSAGAATTPQPPRAAATLPPGWVSALDPCSGTPYYSNLQTGASQWAPPSAPAALVPTPPAAPALPPGWQEGRDPASGHMYYYNAASGVTQWERPSPAVPAPPPAAPEPPPPLPPGDGPPLPAGDGPPPPPAEPNDKWRAGQGADASVRVGGVPSDMGDLDLRDLFSRCGTILSVQLTGSAYSSSTQPRQATIRFDTPASAETAVRQMDGTKLRSNTLKVMLEAQKPRAKPY